MLSAEAIERVFRQLCAQAGRQGVLGFAAIEAVCLMPEQARYLERKLSALGPHENVTAVSLGLFYREQEILAIPAEWQAKASPDDHWNKYARAYGALNRHLNEVSSALVAQLGGTAEQATVEGWVDRVQHVTDYFSHCVSHRAFAEAAGLGWRGRHSLVVTPQAGPALRFATWFVPVRIAQVQQELAGCGDCQACLDVCPILRRGGQYRETCRQRLAALGLEQEVCGICVRACWERVRRMRR